MPRLSPILVAQRNPGDVTVSIVGAQSAAVGALISGAVDSGIRTLPPTLLPSRSRAFGTKGGSEISPTPSGVEAKGQTTPLFGATTVVYIDGAAVVAEAGSLIRRERPVGRRSKKKLRFSVELDGEFVAVATAEEARALLKAQATPKARITRRKTPRIRTKENLRPDAFDIGEVADAAIKSPEIIEMFEAAVAQQSMQALGVLKMELERVRDLPEPVFTPPEIQITPEESQLAAGLMNQVGVFDEVLNAFIYDISKSEQAAYKEMDRIMDTAMRAWADGKITRKKKRFDAFRKVFGRIN